MEFEALQNPNVTLGGGAGIQSAQLMAEKDVAYVLTGNCGPNAHQTLSAAGIHIIVGCSGMVREAVEQFKAGALNAAGAPNVASHFGIPGTQVAQPGPGGGRGRGMGRGMGMGRGGGMGGGRGMGEVPIDAASPPQQGPMGQGQDSDDLNSLREQAESMRQGLEELEERIRQLADGQ
jgi:predicted Fe-Mo cluster-binding NifX family protein